MSALFKPWTNTAFRVALFVLALLFGGGLIAGPMLYVRSPLYTQQQDPIDQPVQFDHRHHVGDEGIDCRYCHTSVEKSAFAGIPPTKTCMNCHAQIWTNAALLEPVRKSWATGESLVWTKVHDLPDYVYFNHSIHVNKGLGCASCHGRVDLMPLMYQQNTLQMEWCLNCHRNPAVNLRPVSEIYNMAWAGPSSDKPVWCASTVKGGATAQNVSCTTTNPGDSGPEVASLEGAPEGPGKTKAATLNPLMGVKLPASYQKFTSQDDLGKFLTAQCHIRRPDELSSCETCHR